MKTAIGLAFILTPIALAILFKVFIENPAMAPLELRAIKGSGFYGELYGPISFLRYVVYGVCAAQVLCGVVIMSIAK